MKKNHPLRNMITIFVLIFGISVSLMAQTPQYYNYNTSAISLSFPLNQPGGKMAQMVIPPANFWQPSQAPAGNITKFYCWISSSYPLGPATYTNFKILFRQWTDSVLTAGSFLGGTWDTVYARASVTLQAASSTWLVFTLDHPFAYVPTQSLLVQMEQCSATGTTTGFSLTLTASTQNRRNWSVGTCPYVYSGVSTGTLNCGVDIASTPFSCTCFPGWKYKVPIVVSNPNASGFTNFEVGDTINTQALITAGKMKADGSDIRFADSLCNNIPYWIQSGINTSTTIIWFKIPNLPASASRTVWMYYGNAAATAVSDGPSTFKFFEGFDGNTLQRFSLSCGSGTATVSGGNCAFSWSSSAAWVADTVLPQANIYVEEMNVVTASGSWPGLMSFNNGGATGGYAMLLGSNQVRISYAVAGNYCSGHNWANTPVAYSTTAGIWSICWQATGTEWGYFPGLGLLTATNTSQTRNADQRLVIGGCSSGSGAVTVDWVRARQFAPIQPIAGPLGSETATPNAPSGLTATPVGNNINLTWVDNSSNEDKFQIQRSSDNGTTWNPRDSVNANVITYSDPIPGNGSWCYRVAAQNCMGRSAYTTQQCVTITGISQNNELPKVFKLYQNYPNPFNPTTNIKFDIPKSSLVKLTIYDITGRVVELLADRVMNAGSYSINWNGSNYSSGVYFYRLDAGTYVKEMKMILVK